MRRVAPASLKFFSLKRKKVGANCNPKDKAMI
jgi:hypothetical protein